MNLLGSLSLIGVLLTTPNKQTSGERIVKDIKPERIKDTLDNPESVADALKDKWSKMTDTHQFTMMIRKLNLSHHQAATTMYLAGRKLCLIQKFY
jgi:putative heme degradation protein